MVNGKQVWPIGRGERKREFWAFNRPPPKYREKYKEITPLPTNYFIVFIDISRKTGKLNKLIMYICIII